jgi:hypothetical protein
MRRFQIPEIILGSLLTVAIFTIGVIFGLRTTASADAEVTGFSWLMKDAAGFFTFGLVLVTAIQATMFYIQLRYMRRGMRDATEAAQAARDTALATREQVKLTEAQIEVTKIGIFDLERAYLDAFPNSVMTDFVLEPPPPSGFFQAGVDPMEVTVTLALKNSGKTRAVMTRAFGEFSQRDIGPSPAYNVLQGTNYVIDLSVSAGESHDFPYSFKSRHIGDQFFFGFVEYNDIFGRRHTSRFCMKLFPAQKPRESGKMQLAGADSWRAFD